MSETDAIEIASRRLAFALDALEAAAKAEREETVAAIREGLADVKAGRTKPARAALKALAKKYGITTPDK